MDTKAIALFGETVELAEVLPAPTVIDRMSMWAEAMQLFLASRKAEATRRSYESSWKDLLSYSEKMPWQIGRDDVQRWVDGMRGRVSQETINLRVAGISSFYAFVMNDYEITQVDGRKARLTDYNPAAARSLREKTQPYGKATALSVKETQALLRAIPQSTVQGLRDYALILTYLATARRNSEIRLLRWGDITQVGSRMVYKWSGKGKKDEKFEMPGSAYQAIVAYLEAAGRAPLTDDEYIFTPLSDHATRLPTVSAASWDRNRPLSLRQVGSLVKKYARRAGLDVTKIHVHTLRHTAAHLRVEAGDSIQDVSELLAHSSLSVTTIYLQRTEGRKDKSWAKVEALIGLD